jgi:glycosyltransferase involved in cell wall biosynthesis
MKVVFSTYSGTEKSPGGGEIQLRKTKEYLEKQGIEVGILTGKTTELKDYDLLHNFSIHRECINNVEKAKKAGIPVAVSTIYWPSKEAFVWQTGLNKLKSLTAGAINKLPFSKQRKIIEKADLLLPNSNAEKEMLVKEFGADGNKIFVVPNAIDKSFLNADKKLFQVKTGLKEFILFVGRIEPRKNTLNLVKALNEIEADAVIIGDAAKGFEKYYLKCKKTSEKNKGIHFFEGMGYASELLKSAFANAKVFVLPSWYETPGLAALEAGALGANLVVTERGCTKEYFKNYATYVDPESVSDLKEKILIELNKPKNKEISEHILNNFTWEETAKKTIQAYNEIV